MHLTFTSNLNTRKQVLFTEVVHNTERHNTVPHMQYSRTTNDCSGNLDFGYFSQLGKPCFQDSNMSIAKSINYI